MLGAGFIALIITLALCIAARSLATALGLIDHPDGLNGRKRHKLPTPLFGGIAVMVPSLLAILNFMPVLDAAWIAIFLVSAGALVIGAVDDRRHIRPHVRLALSGVALLAAIVAVPDLRLPELRFSFIANGTLIGSFLAVVLPVISLLGLQNAVNMADGKNGLVTGLSMIWCVFLMMAAPVEWLPVLGAMLVALAVALGFNIGGRLFLGDAGSYSISVLLGLLSIYIYNNSRISLPADVVMLWFWIPVIDCIRLILQRARDGRSVFSGDRNHLHHLIYDAMPWRYGLALYLGIVLVPGLLALLLPEGTLLMLLASTCLYAIVYLNFSRRPLGVGGMS